MSTNINITNNEVQTRLASSGPLTAQTMDNNLDFLAEGINEVYDEFTSHTGSIQTQVNTLISQTSSYALKTSVSGAFDSVSASFESRVLNLETTPGVDISALNSFTASINPRIDSIESFTQSIQSEVDELFTSASTFVTSNDLLIETNNIGENFSTVNNSITSLNSFTQSFNSISGSFVNDSLNSHSESVDNSLQSINTFTGSINDTLDTFIPSVNTFTSSIQNDVNSLFTSSSEITASVVSIQASLDSINSKTGSFASAGGVGGIFITGSQDPSTFTYYQTTNNLQVSGTLAIRDKVSVDDNIIPQNNSVSIGEESVPFSAIYVNAIYASNGTISGSEQLADSSINNLTLTNLSATGSFSGNYTGSFSGSFNGLFTGDASGLTNFPGAIGQPPQWGGIEGIPEGLLSSSVYNSFDFALTSSANTFYGTQTFNGDITSTGKIKADSFEATGDLSGNAVLKGTTNLFLSASSDGRVIVSGSRFNLQPLQISGTTPSNGDMYFDADTKTIYFGKDSTWVEIWSGSNVDYGDIISIFAENDGTNSLISSSAQISAVLTGADGLDNTNLKPAAGILNAQLANSSVYISNQSVSLGNSASIEGILGGSDVISGSLVYSGFKTAFDSYTASINDFTSSISAGSATLLSNTFVGNQTISGSVDITGSLVVTGSVNISGSVQLTGSVNITGSVQLTGSILSTGSNIHYGDFDVIGGVITGTDSSLSISTATFDILTIVEGITIDTYTTLSDGNLTLDGPNPGQGIISASSLHLTGDTISQTSEYVLTVNGGVNVIGTSETASFVITTGSVAPVGGPTLPPYAGYVVLPHVLLSLDFENDNDASSSGVPLGGIYRTGQVLKIRTT
jgi:cytoskeletal protein CcmA (bactofilin family)